MVAAAWSAPGSPPSWQLTAAQFATLRDDPELLAIAATIPRDRLPPLLFTAAATSLILSLEPQPLRDLFPRLGEPQPPLGPGFAAEYRDFCVQHRGQLRELCARHRYQMNEVGRCAEFVSALAGAADSGREVVFVDIGTGAGLALHFDRYRYMFRGAQDRVWEVGPRDAPVTIDVELRGGLVPPIPSELPVIADRVGIDIEPLDLTDRAVRGWLTACVPQEIGAVTRFHQAAEVALAHPARSLRGDACELLPDLLDGIPNGPLICIADSYVNVFFRPAELERFREIVDAVGRKRDLDWISTDPLVPMGAAATSTVTAIPAPAELLERARRGGVFGTISRLSYRRGRLTRSILGAAHPSGVWLEWLDRDGSRL